MSAQKATATSLVEAATNKVHDNASNALVSDLGLWNNGDTPRHPTDLTYESDRILSNGKAGISGKTRDVSDALGGASSSRGLSVLLDELETIFGGNFANEDGTSSNQIWKHRGRSYTGASAALFSSIVTSRSYSDLIRLYSKHQQHMKMIHIAAMMKKLARLVQRDSGASSDFLGVAQAHLWCTLLDKAALLMPSAGIQQDVDVLTAIHLIAERREHQNLGWSRAAPPSSEDRNQPEAGSNIDPDDGSDRSDHETSAPSMDASPLVAGLRPLHSSRSLTNLERRVVRLALQHSQGLLVKMASSLCNDSSVSDIQRLLAAVGRLGMAPGDRWQEAFFLASESHLAIMDKSKLLALACGVSRLQPACKPSASWLSNFFSRVGRIMYTLDPRELSIVSTAMSRLPKPYPDDCIQALLRHSTECLDSFDAPAYALLLHSVGRMRRRTPKAWVQEILESSAGLLYDFSSGEESRRHASLDFIIVFFVVHFILQASSSSHHSHTEELSLILRGCALLKVCPDDDWLLEFFTRSINLLPTSSGPQLANMGWALSQLRCQPPRQWLHEWGQQLRKRATPNTADEPLGRPLRVPAKMWHGVGYSAHAQRAAIALRAFGIRDLEGWCTLLRTPVPPPLEGSSGPMRRTVRMDEESPAQEPGNENIQRDLQPKLHVSPLPASAAEQASQAAVAIEAAFRDGVRRQCVELLLLQPETGQDDWPGGIRQQWRVAQPLVETILRTIKKTDGLIGPLSAEIWDQGDAVAAWTGEKLAAVLFPTASSMDQVN